MKFFKFILGVNVLALVTIYVMQRETSVLNVMIWLNTALFVFWFCL